MSKSTGADGRQVNNALRVMEALSAYLGGRVEPTIALCADNVVWRSIAEPQHAPFGGTFHGRDGVRSFFEAMFAAFDIYERRVVDVIPAGDEVVHIVRLDVRKKDGTSDGSALVAGRWRFRDGLVVSYTDYFNVAAAIQTSTPALKGQSIARDPSFAVYQNENAIKLSEALVRYRSGQTEPLVLMLSSDVNWAPFLSSQAGGHANRFRGPDAVRDYFTRMFQEIALQDYLIVDVIPAGPEVVHIAEIHASLRADPTKKFCVRVVCFWTFKDGLATSMIEYFDAAAYWSQIRASRP